MISITPELAVNWIVANDSTLISLDGDTEIGDAEQPDFYPQIKLKRWGNEANFSMRLDMPNFTFNELRSETDTIVWRRGPIGIRFRLSENGEFDFSIILHSQPLTNEFIFTLTTKDARLYLQPLLTQVEINAGKQRPPRVVNSIAIYSSKRNNKYKIGKIAHLFRPQMTDTLGNQTWGRWEIVDATTIKIVLPQPQINAAIYPTRIR